MSDNFVTIQLTDALDGYHVVVDPEAVDFGVIEDFESQKAGRILDALLRMIRDSNLPNGHDREGLRRLTIKRMVALLKGVGELTINPKS